MSRKWTQLAGLLSLAVSIALLGGCASPAGTKAMVSDSAHVVHKHPYSVSVRTAGGRETSSIGTTQISDEAFANALTESISATRVFSSVVQGNDADYLLSVAVVEVEQPMFGFDLRVNLEAGWSLTELKSGKVVWKNSIKSTYAAGVGDAFVAVERLRLATEGAARENIRQGLQELSQLSL